MTVTELVCVSAVVSLLGGCGARDGLWNSVESGGEGASAAAGNLGGVGGQTQTMPVAGVCGPNSAACLGSEYCEYPLGGCRNTADSGWCVGRPSACSHRYMPVCACDGQLYDNSCLAQASGADIPTNGACVPDPVKAGDLWVRCGGMSAANPELAYCEVSRSASDGVADFNVHLLPPACLAQIATASASCDCFPKDTPCLEGCSVARVGAYWGFTFVCAKPR